MRVISSANGLTASIRAFELLTQGANALDAVVEAATLVEDDPNDKSVGFGGYPNAEGIVELDAAVMHGPSGRAGAVAGLRNVRNATRVARLVMEKTGHVLLVGAGALQFARMHGFREEDLLTEKSRAAWMNWKERLGADQSLVVPPDTLRERDITGAPDLSTGTVHFSALDANGDISCVTSTSGLAFKISGRVGDTAIVGAGLYVDNTVGSCGSTGLGEVNQINLSSCIAVELMKSGLSPLEAGLEMLHRIETSLDSRRRHSDTGKPNFDLKLYLMAKDGRYAGVSFWGPAQFAVADQQGARLEDCRALYVK